MKLLTIALAGAMLGGVLVPGAVLAQGSAKPGAAAASLDPAAMAALERMGGYLRTLKAFSVTSYSSTEDVLASGQKIETGTRVDYVVQMPNKLYAEVTGDNRNRQYYFDGTTFTVRGGQNDYYAQMQASGTINQLLTAAYEQHGIDLPLQDLFRWGGPSSAAARPYAGFLVGPSQVGQWKTDHYAFRQQGVDFQLWIEQGDKPLPRKLVITSLDDPTQPEYTALFEWNLAPAIDPARFTYTPGPEAKKIPFMTAAPAVAAK